MCNDLDSHYQACCPGTILLVSSAVISLCMLRLGDLYRGRMLVIPHRQGDLYSRLWCVYEIFVAKILGVPVRLGATIASAGTCSSATALCSSVTDTRSIRSEIEAHGWHRTGDSQRGFGIVDKSIRRTMRRQLYPLLATLALQSYLFVITTILAWRFSRRAFDAGIDMNSGHLLGNTLGPAAMYSWLYYIARESSGQVSTRHIFKGVLIQIIVGSCTFLMGYGGLQGYECEWSTIPPWKVNLTALFYNMGLFLWIFAFCPPLFLFLQHFLLRRFGSFWYVPLMVACTLFWIATGICWSYVSFGRRDDIYPSVIIIIGFALASCGPNLAVVLAARWGVVWWPVGQLQADIGRLAAVICTAFFASLVAVGIVMVRAVRCSQASI